MRANLRQRVGAVLTAPFGSALTSWSYIWRITPVHRRQLDGSLDENAPPPLPPGISREGMLAPEDGSGPLYHRTYTGRIKDARCGAADLIERVAADPNRVVPLALARFKKTSGPEWRLQEGDEFLVRMLGPWDGPVRAVQVTPTSFRFATLDGHLEAGQIEWRAYEKDDRLVFQIVSWARSGDRLSAIMHDRLLMAKEVQLHMWTSVVEHVAREAGGRLVGGVDVETRRVDGRVFARDAR
jgi:Domain of unknown function (DUF1990)